LNSAGCYATFKKSSYGVGLEGMLVRDGDILYVGDSQGSCHPDIDFAAIAAEVIRQLELARRNVSISSGNLPVIFTPFGVAGSLLSPLLSALNGKTVFDGASPLKDKLGQKMMDGRFTLWDNPHLSFQPGSVPFDDEGVPAQKHALVREGVVNQFYYDLHTAALAGTASTGNGSRGSGMPSPSPHQLLIDGGESSPADMLRGIKEGIVIEMLMGAEQGNILNGDFSGNVLLGYKIENGEMAGRVKDTMVHANVYSLLKDIAAIGNDARWIGGSVKVPSICFPAISVSAK
jgi:PmbA protein